MTEINQTISLIDMLGIVSEIKKKKKYVLNLVGRPFSKKTNKPPNSNYQ